MEVIIYSEDRRDSEKELESLKTVLKKIFLIINNRTRTDLPELKPLNSGKRINGSLWKAKKSKNLDVRRQRNLLITTIASELKLKKYIAFHVDGDDVWSKNNRAEINTHKAIFIADVKQVISSYLSSLTALQVDEIVSNFFYIVPFYSIESWAYANKDRLKEEILERKISTAEDKEIIETPIQDLDEIAQIKDKTSIRDFKNFELFNDHRLPWDELYNVQKSFYSVVEEMKKNPNLIADLQKTADQPF